MLRRVNQPVGGRHPLSMFHIVLVHDKSAHARTNYRQNLSYKLGYIQMLIGLLCIILQSVANHLGCIGSIGVWVGVFFFITGILCLWTARDRTGCLIMCMVFLSMFSILFAIILTIVAGQTVSGQCQMNIALITLAVTDGLAASVSIWIGGSSMFGKRQPSSSAAVITQPASDMTGTHLTGDFTAVLPPCQMSLPTVPGQQPTLPPDGDLSRGFQSQHVEKPMPMISPKTPPRYTPMSDPPPVYSEAVLTAPSSDQSVSM